MTFSGLELSKKLIFGSKRSVVVLSEVFEGSCREAFAVRFGSGARLLWKPCSSECRPHESYCEKGLSLGMQQLRFRGRRCEVDHILPKLNHSTIIYLCLSPRYSDSLDASGRAGWITCTPRFPVLCIRDAIFFMKQNAEDTLQLFLSSS